MIGRLDHIGIAVEKIEKGLSIYRDIMNLKLERVEILEKEKTRVAILPVGTTRIELLEPLSPDSPVAKFIEKRGEGVHHLAFTVQDIDEAMARVRKEGLKLVDEQPRAGLEEARVVFIHPKSLYGVLVELREEKASAR